ncbi:MAG: hypothetical protein IJF83_03280 [Methanobrevibacter sp.]|nr:hypothetical protein [Methanobrevibacter sp.]
MSHVYVSVHDWDAMLREDWNLAIMFDGQRLTREEVQDFCSHFLFYKELIDKRDAELTKYINFFRLMKECLPLHELDELKKENEQLRRDLY